MINCRVANSEEAYGTILFSSMGSSSYEAAGRFHQTNTLLRTIRRQRQTEVKDTESGLPDCLKQTDRDKDLVLHEVDKLIAFTNTSNLSVLISYKHWFTDGTFVSIARVNELTNALKQHMK
jgi:hypothetical protein